MLQKMASIQSRPPAGPRTYHKVMHAVSRVDSHRLIVAFELFFSLFFFFSFSGFPFPTTLLSKIYRSTELVSNTNDNTYMSVYTYLSNLMSSCPSA